MRLRRAGLVAVLLPACALAAVPALGAASASAASRPVVAGIVPTRGELLPSHNDDATSLNWSGYDVNGTGISGVTTSFTVPTAGTVPPGFTASWAGIGGYSTSDLIQAGASADSVPATGSQYYAWYEILPAGETQLTDCSGDSACTVNPGDTIKVDIHKIGADLWSVYEENVGHWSFQLNVPYASSQSSAEWIFEAPTVVVQTIPGNVGVAHFGGGNRYTDGSGTHTIAQGNPVSIAMGPGLVNEATPSALGADGSSFNACTYAQTCAAP